MNMTSRLEKHLGKGEKLVINGEEFYIKPLTTDNIPDFLKLGKAFGKGGTGLENLNDEEMKIMQRLVEQSLAVSFPDETEQVRKEFGYKYFMPIMSTIMNVNSTDAKTEKASSEIIKERLKTG